MNTKNKTKIPFSFQIYNEILRERRKKLEKIYNELKRYMDYIFVRYWLKMKKGKTFIEWEENCINFNTLKYIPNHLHKPIFEIFVNEKGLNYWYFWKINKVNDTTISK